MRIFILTVTVFTFFLTACTRPTAENRGRLTAILVSPIHEAQVVHGDDGMDHVEYDLLVVSAVDEPVTLSSVTVLDNVGKELLRIEGDTLKATTQAVFSKTPMVVLPPSAAVSVGVDLTLPPGTTPERVTHRIAYTLPAGTASSALFDVPKVDGPEVAINRQEPIVIKPPLKGDGWFASTACCKPNVHRDLRIAIDGGRIETGETFAIDWALVKNNKIYDGDGSKNEQYYGFGADVFAVADGTIVSIQDGKPEASPNVTMTPKTKSDIGGNYVILKIASANVFAFYAHLQAGSLKVKVGDVVKVGAPLAKLGNTGPSSGPHLHLGLSNSSDPFTGRSLPFVFESFTKAGAVDFTKSEKGNNLVISSDSRQLRSAYPLYGGIHNFP